MTSHKKFALISSLLAAIATSGCEWHADLYEKYVTTELDANGNDIDKLVRCPKDTQQGELAYVEVWLASSNYEDNEENSNSGTMLKCTNDCQNIKNGTYACVQTDIRCKSVVDAFEYGLCPKDMECRLDKDNNYYYCTSPTNLCKETADCETYNWWKKGKCTEGKCVPEECNENVAFLYDEETPNRCEYYSIDHCGGYKQKCEVEHSIEVECNQGQCRATQCEPRYHLVYETGQCEENSETSCGNKQTNCKLLNGWKKGTCNDLDPENVRCEATDCDINSHVYNKFDGENYIPCEGNTNINCKNENCEAKSQEVPGTVFWCVEGQCVLRTCEKNYHLSADGTKCNPDSAEECGFSGVNCKKLTGVDNNSNGITCNSPLMCHVEKCAPGYHRTGNDGLSPCEADSIYNCNGAPCNTNEFCTIVGSKSECKTRCIEPQVLCKQQCINYNTDINNCGGCAVDQDVEKYDCERKFPNAFVACNSGSCSIESCRDGYYLNNNSCEKEDVNNCGKDSNGKPKKCNLEGSTNPKCRSGVCIAEECSQGYHLYANICEIDSLNNCGEHGKNCVSDGNNMPIKDCVNGKCKIECDPLFEKIESENGYSCRFKCPDHAICDERAHIIKSCKYGYYLSHNECKQITGENCGKDGEKCYGNDFCKLKLNGSFCSSSYQSSYTQVANTNAYYVNFCNEYTENMHCNKDNKLGICRRYCWWSGCNYPCESNDYSESIQ